MPDSPMPSLALGLAALCAAALAHFALWRLGRRLPLRLADRARRKRQGRGLAPPAPGVHLIWQHRLELALLPFKWGIWLAAGTFAVDRFPGLGTLRRRGVELLAASFNRPLFAIEKQAFSAADLVMLPIALGALWICVAGVTWLFRSYLLRPLRLEASAEDSLTGLLRYALLFVGGLIVLQVWGLDARTLAIVGSVLGIGLGFGLQNIANNFVSGLLIGLERPIKSGDFVEVGKFSGTVERIGARSAVIRTTDRVSILVPNSRFLETEVINWSHGDPVSRLRIPVPAAYSSPIAKVRNALLGVARRHPDVLDEPAPTVQLTAFGDSALHFDLLVWTRDPREQSSLKSDLNFGIESAFRREGLEMPLPQRVVHAAQAEEATAGAPAAKGEDGADRDLAGRPWTEEELAALATQMRGEGGVAIEDRRHLWNVYPRCLTGREAVDWLVRAEGTSRREALRVGRLLVERGLLHHVLDEHPFEDANYFYRFYADEQAG
ncbi:MAG: mechanosensitive ion channel domain-containing protein [Acidobacteriota bacterium]